MKFIANELMRKLPLPANEKWKDGVRDITAFRKGDVSMIFFAPEKRDFQTFHEDDEFYFIADGAGELIIGNERFSCIAGDAFFVPARTEHHFENFTEDFATWAVFF